MRKKYIEINHNSKDVDKKTVSVRRPDKPFSIKEPAIKLTDPLRYLRKKTNGGYDE